MTIYTSDLDESHSKLMNSIKGFRSFFSSPKKKLSLYISKVMKFLNFISMTSNWSEMVLKRPFLQQISFYSNVSLKALSILLNINFLLKKN